MLRKLARPMLASVYVADGVDTLMHTDQHVDSADAVAKKLRTVLPRKYSRHLPKDPAVVARAIGGAKVGAGSLLAIGKAPRLAAGTLALLSVPTMLGRYAFWETQDDDERSDKRSGFLTQTALLGGVLITSADTAGKPGLAWRAQRAGRDANKAFQRAMPGKTEQQKMVANAQDQASTFADNAKNFISDASDKVAEATAAATSYVEDNKDDWLKTAQKNAKVAKKHLVKVAAEAQDRAAEAAEKGSKNAAKLQKRADKATAKAQKRLAKKYNL